MILVSACVRNTSESLILNPTQQMATEFTEVFRDDFSGNSLDTSKWSQDNCENLPSCGNNERQTYRPQNVTIQNGTAIITVTESADEYTSGKIQTRDLHQWTYGRFEIC